MLQQPPDIKEDFSGIQAERVLYCYNPPHLRGEGPLYVIYQLRPFNADKWMNNKHLTTLRFVVSKDVVWTQGRMLSDSSRKALQAVLTKSNIPKEARYMFPWKEWLNSKSVYFYLISIDGVFDGSPYYDIRVLDKKNYKLYSMGEDY